MKKSQIILASILILFAVVKADEDDHDHEEEHGEVAVWETWVYSIVASVLVSLCSLAAAAILALKSDAITTYGVPLLAFSFSTLVSASLFSLLPETVEVLGFDQEAAGITLAGLAFGVILSFVADPLVHKISEYLSSRSNNSDSDKAKEMDNVEENGNASLPERPTEVVDLEINHKHHFKGLSNASMAVNILISDGIHNFIDGVLIGVTFGESVTTGITTSLAIVFHEIPQEIGDFKLLVQAGFSIKKAFFFNFISASTAILGAIVGAAASHGAEDFANHFIPFAAGQFLYLALGEVFPELRKLVKTNRDKLLMLLSSCIGVGIILGLTYLPWQHSHGEEEHHH
jgi:zinc transporter ZupT